MSESKVIANEDAKSESKEEMKEKKKEETKEKEDKEGKGEVEDEDDEEMYTLSIVAGRGKERKVSGRVFLNRRDLNRNICIICKQLLKYPVMVNNVRLMKYACGHVFCKGCIEQWLDINSTCPECRSEAKVSDLVDLPLKVREIGDLEVECPHKGRGCTWKGTFGSHGSEYGKHVAKCSYRGRVCGDCKNIIEWAKIDGHESTCPEKRVICPMGPRCGKMMPRSKVDEHLKVCAFVEIDCKYSGVGCLFRGIRMDVHAHEHWSSNVHLSMVKEALFAERAKNKRIREELQEVERELEEVKRMAGDGRSVRRRVVVDLSD